MKRTVLTAKDWHAVLKARFDDRISTPTSALPFSVTMLSDLPKTLHQPALLDDILCLHLDGAKRVYRKRDVRQTGFDVPVDSMTVISRHRETDWRTEGPDDYVHITLQPKPLDDLLVGECGKARSDIELHEDVGFQHPLLLGLSLEMLRIVCEGDASQLYVDTLFTAFGMALLRHASTVGESKRIRAGLTGAASGGMAGWRLRRVVEFMNANRMRDVGLAELTEVAGLSRAHFFRAFRQETGVTPLRYFESLRVAEARRSIERGDDIEIAVAAGGFATRAAMTRAFRRELNVTPEVYQRWYR